MQQQGYEKGFFSSTGRGIAATALLGVFLWSVLTYFDQSQRPFLEKVASIVDLIIKKSAERTLSDETLAKTADGALLPRAVAKAVEQNDLATIRQALDAGLDINAHDYAIGMTLLHHAAAKKNLELVTLLIARGADVNAKDKDHSTPLHFAAYKKGNIKILTYLIQHGAVRDLVDDERLTPLDYAKLADDAEMIAALSVTSDAAHGSAPHRKAP
jgi:Ankyrin repeats (many copies)